MAQEKISWDAELYEAKHNFVWQLGSELVDMLAPKPGERILDLGCGPGQLTAKIAEAGANVVGVDSSPEMIGQARQNYPALQFRLQDAATMTYNDEFDAIFSNAALHWMLDAHAVADAMARALRKAGRLVLEMGGRGNIAAIQEAVESVCRYYLEGALPPRRNFFPAIGEYANILEDHGFEVRFARLFDRPTPLEGERAIEQWMRQFFNFYLDAIPASSKEKAITEVVEKLRPNLWKDQTWYADYRRLRIFALKL